MQDNVFDTSVRQEPETPKKRKKPFILRLFKFLFILLIILGIASCVGAGYVYIKYNINAFSLVGSAFKIDKKMDKQKIYDYSDVVSLESKLNNASKDDVEVLLTDEELTAFFNEKGGTTQLLGYDAQLISITFKNPTLNEDYKVCDIAVMYKINIADLKTEKMSEMPLDMVAKIIPDNLYLTLNMQVGYKNEEYSAAASELTINNLSKSQSKEIINVLRKVTEIDEYNMIYSNAGVAFWNGFSELYKAMPGSVRDYGINQDGDFGYLCYLVDPTIRKTITYKETKNVVNDNATSYSIKDGVVTLSPIECVGYTFLGWYDGETKIESFNTKIYKDLVLTAKWEIIEYTITYDLGGGTVNGTNPTKYTIEDKFEIINPTKEYAEFLGWVKSGTTEKISNFAINKGSYGDITLTAVFKGETNSISIYVGTDKITELTYDRGTVLAKDDLDKLFIPSEQGMSGYSINKWYTDTDCAHEFTFGNLVLTDVVLYGQWEYLFDNISFAQYYTEFTNAVANGTKLTIDSADKLKSYASYVKFYDITEEVELELTYVTDSSKLGDELSNAVASAINDGFNTNTNIGYGYAGTACKIYISESTRSTDATLTMDPSKTMTNIQQDFALKEETTSPRSSNFNSFNINKVTKTLTVYTSNQLVYALENGYKPICAPASSAEVIYNKAKDVLIKIVDDDMNDTEKLKAIYEWLVYNVNYDQKAYSRVLDGVLSSADCAMYDSWYAEGVFNKGVAVCEGYAKSLLIMAEIENIPCVYVTGNNHAWNKVMIDSKWYVIDATHGDSSFSGTEANPERSERINYRNFLITDAYKANLGYATADYKEFVADTKLDSYDTFGLYIDSTDEAKEVFTSIKTYTKKCGTYYTLEFTSNLTNDQLLNAIALAGLTNSTLATPTGIEATDVNGHRVVILKCTN